MPTCITSPNFLVKVQRRAHVLRSLLLCTVWMCGTPRLPQSPRQHSAKCTVDTQEGWLSTEARPLGGSKGDETKQSGQQKTKGQTKYCIAPLIP